jgi:hypothetical protein
MVTTMAPCSDRHGSARPVVDVKDLDAHYARAIPSVGKRRQARLPASTRKRAPCPPIYGNFSRTREVARSGG